MVTPEVVGPEVVGSDVVGSAAACSHIIPPKVPEQIVSFHSFVSAIEYMQLPGVPSLGSPVLVLQSIGKVSTKNSQNVEVLRITY